MVKNYIKITFRNFLKYKFYSLTNILGLTTGFGCFILISLYINNEISFDNFHNESDKIFRVLRVANDESQIREIGVTSAPYAEALKNDFPEEIESVTRVNHSDGLVVYKDKSFKEDKICFADENFNRLYEAEQKEQTLFTIFSFLAIFIASMGLLGLVMYATETRKKEIGVRKVLGATIPSVVTLLSKEFLKLIIIANLISWPIAYYFMNKWLEDFAYKINLGFDSFLIGAFITLLIAMLTNGFQVIKAAVGNPVDSIKYE